MYVYMCMYMCICICMCICIYYCIALTLDSNFRNYQMGKLRVEYISAKLFASGGSFAGETNVEMLKRQEFVRQQNPHQYDTDKRV